MPTANTLSDMRTIGRKTQRPDVDAQRLYKTQRWRKLRQRAIVEHLKANGAVCACGCKGPLTFGRPGHRANAEVDHIMEHQGNLQLFYNLANLQVLRKECHSRKTHEATLKSTPSPAG